MPLLETRNLTAFYGDFQALYGIDTTLDAGETIAIIGANGAGQVDLPEGDRRPHSAARRQRPARRPCRSAQAPRPTSSSSALRWCRKDGGCFPR